MTRVRVHVHPQIVGKGSISKLWFQVQLDAGSIGKLVAKVLKELGVCPEEDCYLYLEGFLLQPQDDVCILRDNDCLQLVPAHVHTQLQAPSAYLPTSEDPAQAHSNDHVAALSPAVLALPGHQADPSHTVNMSPVGRSGDGVNAQRKALPARATHANVPGQDGERSGDDGVNAQRKALPAGPPHANVPGQDGEQASLLQKKRKLKPADEDARTPVNEEGPAGGANARKKRKGKKGAAVEAEGGGSGREGGDRRDAPAGDGEGGEGRESGGPGLKSKKRKAGSATLAANFPKKPRESTSGNEEGHSVGVESGRTSSDAPSAAEEDGPARVGAVSTPAPNQTEGEPVQWPSRSARRKTLKRAIKKLEKAGTSHEEAYVAAQQEVERKLQMRAQARIAQQNASTPASPQLPEPKDLTDAFTAHELVGSSLEPTLRREPKDLADGFATHKTGGSAREPTPRNAPKDLASGFATHESGGSFLEPTPRNAPQQGVKGIASVPPTYLDNRRETWPGPLGHPQNPRGQPPRGGGGRVSDPWPRRGDPDVRNRAAVTKPHIRFDSPEPSEDEGDSPDGQIVDTFELDQRAANATTAGPNPEEETWGVPPGGVSAREEATGGVPPRGAGLNSEEGPRRVTPGGVSGGAARPRAAPGLLPRTLAVSAHRPRPPGKARGPQPSRGGEAEGRVMPGDARGPQKSRGGEAEGGILPSDARGGATGVEEGSRERRGDQMGVQTEGVGAGEDRVGFQGSLPRTTADFEALEIVRGLPMEGDVVAYQLYFIDEDYTPQVSEWRCGRVIDADTASETLTVEPWPDVNRHPVTGRKTALDGNVEDWELDAWEPGPSAGQGEGKDEDEENDIEDPYDSNGVLTADLPSFGQLRLITSLAVTAGPAADLRPQNPTTDRRRLPGPPPVSAPGRHAFPEARATAEFTNGADVSARGAEGAAAVQLPSASVRRDQAGDDGVPPAASQPADLTPQGGDSSALRIPTSGGGVATGASGKSVEKISADPRVRGMFAQRRVGGEPPVGPPRPARAPEQRSGGLPAGSPSSASAGGGGDGNQWGGPWADLVDQLKQRRAELEAREHAGARPGATTRALTAPANSTQGAQPGATTPALTSSAIAARGDTSGAPVEGAETNSLALQLPAAKEGGAGDPQTASTGSPLVELRNGIPVVAAPTAAVSAVETRGQFPAGLLRMPVNNMRRPGPLGVTPPASNGTLERVEGVGPPASGLTPNALTPPPGAVNGSRSLTSPEPHGRQSSQGHHGAVNGSRSVASPESHSRQLSEGHNGAMNGSQSLNPPDPLGRRPSEGNHAVNAARSPASLANGHAASQPGQLPHSNGVLGAGTGGAGEYRGAKSGNVPSHGDAAGVTQVSHGRAKSGNAPRDAAGVTLGSGGFGAPSTGSPSTRNNSQTGTPTANGGGPGKSGGKASGMAPGATKPRPGVRSLALGPLLARMRSETPTLG